MLAAACSLDAVMLGLRLSLKPADRAETITVAHASCPCTKALMAPAFKLTRLSFIAL